MQFLFVLFPARFIFCSVIFLYIAVHEFSYTKLVLCSYNYIVLCRRVSGDVADIAVQLDVFNEQRECDEAQSLQGPSGINLSSHLDVFYAILGQVNHFVKFHLSALELCLLLTKKNQSSCSFRSLTHHKSIHF